jgi:cell fate regulator YaaT (PSP1 superfamily)
VGKFVVRYGAMRNLGVMSGRGDEAYRRGTQVVVRSNRGLEVGEVLCAATDDALSQLDSPPAGSILRNLSEDDRKQLDQLSELRDRRIEFCKQQFSELGLQMKLVELEQLLGGERIIVYYVAPDRIDFRELVKRLAGEFQTRIEMNQIGVRDEAKLLADYGDCGKPLCCNTHLVQMPPVSMKMAKLQKATLDPTKISGRCGRLKCCLRYEFETYEELQKLLPPVGTQVVTRQGKARVLGHEILSQQLLVETEDHRRTMIDASEVLSTIGKSRGGSEPNHGESGPNRGDSGKKGPQDEQQESTRGERQPRKPRGQATERLPDSSRSPRESGSGGAGRGKSTDENRGAAPELPPGQSAKDSPTPTAEDGGATDFPADQ